MSKDQDNKKHEVYKNSGFMLISCNEYFELVEARKYIRDVRFGTPPLVVAAIEDGCTPLRAWREYKGMTQVELSETANVQRTVISRIETRKNKPRWATLKKLADTLMIDPDQLDIFY